MTLKPKMVKALKAARSRLRDLAAAEHSNASVARDRSAQTLEQEHASLESALDQASDSLAAARTVHELDHVAQITDVYRLTLADAVERHQIAVATTESTADRLRERTRQLRTAERLVEIVEHRRARRESKAERSRVDDMSGARRR